MFYNKTSLSPPAFPSNGGASSLTPVEGAITLTINSAFLPPEITPRLIASYS